MHRTCNMMYDVIVVMHCKNSIAFVVLIALRVNKRNWREVNINFNQRSCESCKNNDYT